MFHMGEENGRTPSTLPFTWRIRAVPRAKNVSVHATAAPSPWKPGTSMMLSVTFRIRPPLLSARL